MREILFRGKRLYNGKWVEGFYVRLHDGKGDISHRIYSGYSESDCGDFYPDWFEVDPATVGQYTGLCDKNGKKIYEGDIFKFPDEVWESYYTSCGTEYNSWETENNGVVGYCEDYAGYDFVQYKHDENSVYADLHEDHTIQFADFVRELEVIGNIHDNPELLEVGE